VCADAVVIGTPAHTALGGAQVCESHFFAFKASPEHMRADAIFRESGDDTDRVWHRCAVAFVDWVTRIRAEESHARLAAKKVIMDAAAEAKKKADVAMTVTVDMATKGKA
jgi:hypothetical protein